MKRIHVRTLLNYTTEELWNILEGVFECQFDDGEVLQVNARDTLYSSYGWEFHRQYPRTPLLKKHHVQVILGDKRLGSDTHLELLGVCMWSVYDHFMNNSQFDQSFPEAEFRDMLAERVYQLTNQMFNDLSFRLEPWVASLDILDFMEVLNQTDIKYANDHVVETQKSIDDTYAVINSTLLEGIKLPQNPISLAVRSKLVNISQVDQCVGPRGFLTDTDSHLFPKPVLTGYANGIRLFHDSLIESRSAAKSLIFSKTPLQQAEYFSRRLQLMSQIITTLHHGDCGSQKYLYWKVEDTRIEKGDLKRQNNLKQLIGKHYMDDDGVLKTITSSSHHLVGRTLKLRSVIHCAHPDPYGVCSACFGELSLSVPAGTNLGQICCTSLAQKSSQNVMSVKHLDGSSVVEGIILDDYDKKYLKVAPDDNSYLFADYMKDKNVHLLIPVEHATNITDIMEVKEIETLNITRVSELVKVGISYKEGVSESDANIDSEIGRKIEWVGVNLGRRLASMTYPFLQHIREHGWTITEKGDYSISLEGWDWSKPFLTLPLKHFNMSDHSA